MAFKSDTRGLGGQKQIMNLMQNHYSALVNIKPTLNTQVAPRKHVKARPASSAAGSDVLREKLVTAPTFSEQRETFKRIAAVKGGYTDHGAPDTLHLAAKMAKNKRARAQNVSHAQ